MRRDHSRAFMDPPSHGKFCPRQTHEEAKAAGIEGTVRLEALINEKGEIVDLSVVWGPEELRNSALSAVSQWRYEALDVKVKTDIDINYVLAKDEKEKK